MADNEPDDDLVDYDEEEVCPKIRLHLDRYTLCIATAARSRSFRLRETSTISTRHAVIEDLYHFDSHHSSLVNHLAGSSGRYG